MPASAHAPREDVAVQVQGGKNLFNHVAAAALLGDNDFQLNLHNVPSISDRLTVTEMLAELGVQVSDSPNVTLRGGPTHNKFPIEATRRLRVSICYGVALAARIGSCEMVLPGGDAFTYRPVDLHIRALRAAGATVEQTRGRLSIHFDGRPSPFEVDLSGDYGTSMGASVSALLLAATADGVSQIRSPSPEPEVEAVLDVLTRFGVSIQREGNELHVHGVGRPLQGVVDYRVAGDRIEAATLALIAAARNQDVCLKGITAADLDGELLSVLSSIGLELQNKRSNQLVVRTRTRNDEGTTVITGAHPGFPSDAQPQIATYLSLLSKPSQVHERVYRRRVSHVPELARLGVHIDIDRHVQLVRGGQIPRGGSATVRDIRCGAALILAASASEHQTLIHDPARHLVRGYSNLVVKLRAFGIGAEVDKDNTYSIG